MRDKRFCETQGRRAPRRSHPPAPSPAQLSRPAFNADGALIDATPARLRQAFGRCQDPERARLRDIRIEQNRLAAIAKSDRAMRRHVIAMAKLERELAGVVFRLTARIHDRKKAVPTKRRKRPDMAPVRRLPGMGITIVDRAGRRGILVEVTSVGANQPRHRSGCCRLHLNYIWAENAVERLASGALARCSNMGPTPELVAAAMDLKEDVARASRANANIEIRIIIRLPDDIGPEGRMQILEQVCETFFGRNGLPYAAAVHPPDPHSDERNFHGHVQAGFRPMRHVGGSDWEVGTELRTDLSRPDGMRLLRAVIADTMTEVVQKEGRQRVYTALSNQERGLSLRPLKKVGREQTEAYRRGDYVGVVEENRRIIADNLKRYAQQRMAWLKEAMAGLGQPHIPAADVALRRSAPAALAAPQMVGRANAAEEKPGLAAPIFPDRIVSEKAQSAAPLTPPEPVLTGLSGTEQSILTAPAVTLPSSAVIASVSRSSRPPLAPADTPPARRSTARSAVPKATLPAPAVPRAAVPGIDDALLLLQLRSAQKKEREALAKRRGMLLDRHLFQQGDPREPTPEYGAFLLAIRDDPTRLRWQLDKAGRRHAPVLAGGDEAFRDRFALYMQHPAVQRQVAALLTAADRPGSAWPDELANGMWRYEPGRYGHRAATAARAGWATGDARFRQQLTPAGSPAPILTQVDELVVPDLARVLRWSDADLMRLRHPSLQRDLTILWREQEEERVECLAAVADGTAIVERRLVAVGGNAFRPRVEPIAVPAPLTTAFARWQDDPDFYLDVAPDSAAAKAAAERKARCADPHRRALQAAQDGGDDPAVQRLLAVRAGVEGAAVAAGDGRETKPKTTPSDRPSPKVQSRRNTRPRSRSPRRS